MVTDDHGRLETFESGIGDIVCLDERRASKKSSFSTGSFGDISRLGREELVEQAAGDDAEEQRNMTKIDRLVIGDVLVNIEDVSFGPMSDNKMVLVVEMIEIVGQATESFGL